ncbi:hypothetical protein FOZ61_010892 [Perkinsus olseni]|uniref:Uncharacterized protein n=2 Tax=Perkinsus olseni TaxID=32597 RepID=A0A7J6M2T2_PEROL|nr:hypothetical protein FOZ61_010892 [Perkinsus olseni]
MLESPDYFLAKKPVLDFLRSDRGLDGMLLLPKLLVVTGSPLEERPEVEGRAIELDPAQQTAMKHILRSPVAIVQGQPGTGGVVRFGGRSKSYNAALELCSARNKAKETKFGYLERKAFQQGLNHYCHTLNAALKLQYSHRARLLCILAYLPRSLFWLLSVPVAGSSASHGSVHMHLKFNSCSRSEKKSLLDQVKAGVERSVTNVFTDYQSSTRTFHKVDVRDLDMDIIDRINADRISFDGFYGDDEDDDVRGQPLRKVFLNFQSDSDSEDSSLDEERAPVNRPRMDDVQYEITREPWRGENSMAVELQARIRRELEKIFGAKNVAGTCHSAIHEAASRVVSNPRDRHCLLDVLVRA